ncbi:hypothetical protein GQ55_4G060200 [Panicum hallii var. hallii]|uniref:Uncharacterized protein n=1 Tax=Panicum hallii var. hallii TaxID=1504633 RepID=A0A2T7DVQ7_9POAL|nr:hypothetical protein GQ55_4G060200 [Panicum hallii var. hallii]
MPFNPIRTCYRPSHGREPPPPSAKGNGRERHRPAPIGLPVGARAGLGRRRPTPISLLVGARAGQRCRHPKSARWPGRSAGAPWQRDAWEGCRRRP